MRVSYSAMCWGNSHREVYCCSDAHGHGVCEYSLPGTSWDMIRLVAQNDAPLLQLFLDYDQENLIGTFMLGFKVK